MPVDTIQKTYYEQGARSVYVLDPQTGEPTGGLGEPLHVFLVDPVTGLEISTLNVAATLDDGWEVVAIADTIANDSDKTFAVPVGMMYQVLWVHVSLASSATAGSRLMAVAVRTAAGTQIFEVRCGVTQAASLTYLYTFAPSLADLTAVRDTTFVMCPLPPTLILTAGQQLRVWDQNAVDAGADDMNVYVQVARRAV